MAVEKELRAGATGLRGWELRARVDEDPRCSAEPRTFVGEAKFFFTFQHVFEDPAADDDADAPPTPKNHYLAYI